MLALVEAYGGGAVPRDYKLPRAARRIVKHWRPATVAQCPTARPCPYVSCRLHLLLHVRPDGTLEMYGAKTTTGRKPLLRAREGEQALWEALWIEQATRTLGEMEYSCALDVARLGGLPPSAVAKYAGLTKRRVSQIEQRLLDELKRAGYEGDGEAAALLAMALETGSV